jgi:perosamine synthetase
VPSGLSAHTVLHTRSRNPGPLFPDLTEVLRYRKEDFPKAESSHQNTLKLPVWHRENEKSLALEYADAFRKVIENHQELPG